MISEWSKILEVGRESVRSISKSFDTIKLKENVQWLKKADVLMSSPEKVDFVKADEVKLLRSLEMEQSQPLSQSDWACRQKLSDWITSVRSYADQHQEPPLYGKYYFKQFFDIKFL